MVGNGNKVQCSRFYYNVPVALGNTQLFTDFYVLPINGADVVLDIQWLKTLSYNNGLRKPFYTI